MSLDLALSIARSGLSNVNRQLAQSASNISNAATAGYTRKTIETSAIVAGTFPSGVRSGEAARAVDAALVDQMNTSRAAGAAAAARARILEGVEVAHGATGESVADLTAALGDAFTALRNDPADTLLRAKAIGAAGDVAERYATVSDAIGKARQAAQDGLVTDVATLNDALRKVSELTDQILPLRAQGLSTADLEDKRDQVVATMSSVMQVRAVPKADGNVVLIGAGGLNLPLHAKNGPFSVAPATLGAESYYGGAGTLPGVMLGGSDVTAQLGTGTLAAGVALRDRELPLAQAELDVSAANLAARFDAQGLTLFTDAAGTVPDPSTPYATGGWLGIAGALRVNPAVSADTRLLRDGTHAVAAGAGGATAFTPNPGGGPARFTTLIDRVLQGTFGDQVSTGIPQPAFASTSLGPGGNLSSTVRTARSLGDYATALVSSQTAAHAAAKQDGTAAADLLSSLESRFATRSGVDMDQELATMVTLQTAYSANARLVSVVQSLYDALFQAVR